MRADGRRVFPSLALLGTVLVAGTIHRLPSRMATHFDAAARRDLEGMLAFYARLLDQPPRCAHHFEAEEITGGEAGDLALVRGNYRFTPDTLRPAQVQGGKFVGVWRRLEGDWGLAISISNGDPP